MSETAWEIGRLAMEIYAGKQAKILQVGAVGSSGALRKFAPDDCSFLSVDLKHGEHVDHMVEAGKPFPFDDATFDLLLVSSFLEHDPAFWNTFLELMRLVREGGHVFLSARSNGALQRYPEDNWRFYPDAGRALQRWASSQGLPIRLIESFVAPRQSEDWNDFVAVFRRGEKDGSLLGRFLHTVSNGENVWTLGSKEPLKPSNETEEIRLLKEADTKAVRLREYVEELRSRAEKDLAAQKTKLDQAISETHTLSSNLTQRREEIAQISRERDEALALIAEKHKVVQQAQSDAQKSHEIIEQLRLDLSKLDKRSQKYDMARKTLKKRVKSLTKSLKARKSEVEIATRSLKDAEDRIDDRFDEIARLSKILSQAEAKDRTRKENRDWLISVFANLDAMPIWQKLLPSSIRAKRRLSRIERAGLFDGKRYLEMYPDVVNEGMDPLRHYILHGMKEGRVRPR